MASTAGERSIEAAVSASSITTLLETAAVDRQVSKQQLSWFLHSKCSGGPINAHAMAINKIQDLTVHHNIELKNTKI
jgi:hypothetical protein